MSVYRTPTLRAPAAAAPPLWQRIVARVAPDLGGAGEWEWYRRAIGGRWCRVRLRDGRGRDAGVVWARVHCCPWPRDIGRHRYSGLWLVGGPPSVPIGWDAEAVHAVDDKGRCACEVWP